MRLARLGALGGGAGAPAAAARCGLHPVSNTAPSSCRLTKGSPLACPQGCAELHLPGALWIQSSLACRLCNREELDAVVSAVTHRKLHPPPAAKPLPAPGPQHAQQAAERAGSRLGGPAAALAAGADSQAAGDATPGGPLSAHPSTQSLQGLLGGPGAAAQAPAASGAAGAAQQTVERRRLDLDALGSPHVVLTSAGMRRQQQMAVSSSEEDGAEADEAAAAGAPEDEPSSAQPSSLLPSRGGSDAGLAYAASVDLINAPVTMEESEEAEMLS